MHNAVLVRISYTQFCFVAFLSRFLFFVQPIEPLEQHPPTITSGGLDSGHLVEGCLSFGVVVVVVVLVVVVVVVVIGITIVIATIVVVVVVVVVVVIVVVVVCLLLLLLLL